MLDDQFKIGDVVAVIGRSGVQSIRKITRILKTKIVLDNGREYKPNGHQAGQWAMEYIRVATPADKMDFRIRQIRFAIDHKIDWPIVPLPILEEVNKLLKPFRLKENEDA